MQLAYAIANSLLRLARSVLPLLIVLFVLDLLRLVIRGALLLCNFGRRLGGFGSRLQKRECVVTTLQYNSRYLPPSLLPPRQRRGPSSSAWPPPSLWASPSWKRARQLSFSSWAVKHMRGGGKKYRPIFHEGDRDRREKTSSESDSSKRKTWSASSSSSLSCLRFLVPAAFFAAGCEW